MLGYLVLAVLGELGSNGTHIALASTDYVVALAFYHLVVSDVGWPGCPVLKQASQDAGGTVCLRFEQASSEAA